MASSVVAILLSLIALCAAQSNFLPVNISEAVIRGQTPGVCPSDQMLDSQLTATRGEITAALRNTVAPVINCPCGGAGPWTRVAGLDFSDPSVPCPAGSTVVTDGGIRGCGRATDQLPGCLSYNFPVNGQMYSRVCGRVIAYQYGSVDGARPGSFIDTPYLDGVSLTYGSGPRQHIWSFIAAFAETSTGANGCPCLDPNFNYNYPDFIGSNYFCDTGNDGPTWERRVYSEDPLWDGAGCNPTNACCDFNNPPWFCTALPAPTTLDMELRQCHDQDQGDEDTVVGLVDIFIM